MKINKLTTISIAVCCLVASLWSEAQSMDNQRDILDPATINRAANTKSLSQNEIDSLDFESIPTQQINVLETQTSWVSYLISPVKANIQMAYDVVNYVVQNPKKGMLVGLCLAYNVSAVAAQTGCCICIYGWTDRGSMRLHSDWTSWTPEQCGAVTGKEYCETFNITRNGFPLYFQASEWVPFKDCLY